jgi:glyoxylase-like metal-dependent hydrolase (beta-lactamase superfamily II)/predicted ester cyclase
VATTDQPAESAPPSARATKTASAKVARGYLAALNAHDVDAACAFWAPGGRETIHGQLDTTAPDGVRAYFDGLFASVPDLQLTELACTAEAERCTIRSRMTGTFAGSRPMYGAHANGARIDLEVVDNFIVREGRITANDAYVDGMTVARQIGLLPPDGSPAQSALTRAFNLKTKAEGLNAGRLEKAAEGVWLLRGGFPRRDFNVFLIEEDDGVTVFDGGIGSMTHAVAAAGARLGGIKRVVLGHAHPDHRGIAAGIDAPIFCHAAERADAESDGGVHYMHLDRLNPLGRRAYPHLLKLWDGGPTEIAGTVEEGEEVAGFAVVHLPGHAPGMIALWRESDRVALTSDAFYVLDPQSGRAQPPRLPLDAFNQDTTQAQVSLRKLAALEPRICWPGHVGPLTGDVRAQLERAADA